MNDSRQFCVNGWMLEVANFWKLLGKECWRTIEIFLAEVQGVKCDLEAANAVNILYAYQSPCILNLIPID